MIIPSNRHSFSGVKYAYLTTNLLDMLAKPVYNSERVNQLLFAETVEISSQRSGFSRVLQADNYSGWVESRFLKYISRSQLRSYRQGINSIVTATNIALAGNRSPHFLFYGTHLAISKTIGHKVTCRLPDSGEIILRSNAVNKFVPKSRKVSKNASIALIIQHAKKYLGVPYLWGGITPAGFDCSGFIRALFRQIGINLPRDTKDQKKVGKMIDRDNIINGDILFFKRHVALALGNDSLIHSSAGGGGVRINSLNKASDNYRHDLDVNYLQTRRLL